MAGVSLSSPFGVRPNRVDRVMLEVILALIPGTLALIWYFGWGVAINMALAALFAVLAEAVALKLRGRHVLPTLRDLSAVVTALLFALAVPPTLPWWLTLMGMVFAIGVAKQLYGGLGYNPFNPAMAGYVFLLVSYPLAMTSWLPPQMLADHHLGFLDALRLIFTGSPPEGLSWDAITMATPLDEMRTQLDQNRMIEEIRTSPLWGDYGGRGWEWVGNWFLLGGIYLLWRRVISWHIPVSMLLGLLLIAGFFWSLDPQTHPFPAFHMFSGGAILGAFFIATDPVTSCTTRKGRLIFGASIGVLVFVIRSWGGYPDAVAFSVLLMNIAAPTIDYYTQPRVFGHGKDSE
jgi:electron transport complex protein RnfD